MNLNSTPALAVQSHITDANLVAAWHISANAWLKQDGISTTDDVEEAGRFTTSEFADLKKQHNGDRFSLVAQKYWNEIAMEKSSGDDATKLEIAHGEFVLWGYGELGAGNYLHIDQARTHISEDMSIDFALPNTGNEMGAPKVYQRRTTWAWRFNSGVGAGWNLANSEEQARQDAKEFALNTMRSTWYHSCHLWFAFKHNTCVENSELELA